VRLKEVTISGFRGFNDKQTLRLDNEVVFVKGSNGSGKSSLAEALEWLFYDEISRRRKSPCKSEYTGDYLRNIHCNKDQETFVEVVADINGKETRLKKRLLSPEKKEHYVDDSIVKDFSSLGLTLDEVYKPILSQVETKHYVETDPKDRWEETNRILGLGIFNEFRTDLQELCNMKKNESTYSSLRKVIYGVESELQDFLELQNLAAALQQRPFSFPTFQKELKESIAQTYSLGPMDIKKLGHNLDKQILKLAQRNESFEAIQKLIVPDYHITTCSSKLIQCFRELFISLGNLRPTDLEMHDFLETGKKLVRDSTCPFCLEKTLTSQKLILIDERIKDAKDLEKLLLNVDSKLKEIRQLRTDMILGTAVFLDRFAVEKVRERISKSEEYKNELKKTVEIKEQIESTDTMIGRLDTELERLIQKTESIRGGKEEFDETEYMTEIDETNRTAEAAEQALGRLKDDLRTLLGILMSKTPTLSAKEKAELNKALLFRKMIDHLSDIKYVGVYENNLNQITDLIEEVEKFEKNKSEGLLANLTGQIKDFYKKLNPNEKIQFSEIVPTKGKSRKIQIKAVSFGKDMNPVSCFSESHMNCLCLSVYFSQRVLNNPYWKFLMLDDPVQTMDENHAKNLIRILAVIAKSKQVIVLSYNAKFCQDFRNLFYGIDYLFYEFSGYSKNGPRIDLKQAPFETYIAIARKYQDGNMEERAIAGNNLRKAIERFALDLLVHKGKMGYGKASELKLDERLEKIETKNLLALNEIGEIRAILNICDAASHEPPRREVTPTELSDGATTLTSLASKHLK